MLQQLIEKKLDQHFSPHHLKVINESYKHNVPEGSESHFKVIIVSDRFENLRSVARHRLVNQALCDELAGGVHALSMHTLTKNEWKEQQFPASPDCMGGGH
ncbi:BolA family protein [Vibrio rarus]|uniref:BolA family protein n=1 Tax=Vibrio rarus TaxID=413403 RepID=UPI0021C4C3A8|nr:BolA/IbaG family iron-sulfur metabolism protein [Vibrio rarus]